MKQTAVEWLIGELKKYDSAGLKDQLNYVIEMPTHILTELEEQAKEMEKQQKGYSEEEVKNAFLDGWQLRDGDLPFPKAKKKWFNEFKKE